MHLTFNNVGLSMNSLAAQAFVFFLAGFETSSTTMTFCLYELSFHQDIKERVREEIDVVLKKHDGKITYEAIQEMEYLDKVVAGKASLSLEKVFRKENIHRQHRSYHYNYRHLLTHNRYRTYPVCKNIFFSPLLMFPVFKVALLHIALPQI
jgi:hypothetical protein